MLQEGIQISILYRSALAFSAKEFIQTKKVGWQSQRLVSKIFLRVSLAVNLIFHDLLPS